MQYSLRTFLYRSLPLLAVLGLLAPAAAHAQDLGCGDTFTDSGGADDDYDNNEDITTVICPAAGTDEAVTVTFTDFDTEGGFDELSVYDGGDASGALLAELSGRGIDAGAFTSTASDGCLTFVFSSDGSVTGGGWSADVTCGPAIACPAPDQVAVLFGDAAATAITVNFRRRGSTTTVEAELGAPGFAPGTGAAVATATAGDVGVTEVTFADLTPETAYEVYVRADCAADGGTGQSDWVGPVETATRPVPPANDDCDGATAVTMQALGEDCAPTSTSSAGATPSGGPSDFREFNDVFVSFEATAPLFDLTFTSEDDDTPLGAVIYELYGECGGAPLEGDFTRSIGRPIVGETELTVGETYYLRIVTGDADAFVADIDFGVCIRAFEIPLLTCGGVFTDTGGEDGDYGNDEDYVVVICPTDGSGEAITVTFTEFVTEDGFDGLEIYDGNGATGDPFDVLTGEVSPGAITSAAPDGCLTFRFTSDGSVTDAGWRADITCGAPIDCPAPVRLAIDEDGLSSTTAAVSFSRRATEPTVVGEIGVPGFAPGTGAALATATVADADVETVSFEDLTAGTAYEIYVRSDCGANGGTGESAWVGPIALGTRQPYDECDAAAETTMLSPTEDCTPLSLTTVNASISGGPSGFTPVSDIFVTFEATAEYVSVELTGTNADDNLIAYAVEFFEDCTTDPLGDFATGQLGTPVPATTPLTVGETYVMRVLTLGQGFFGAVVSEAHFDLCLRAFDPPPAPSNDDCASPAILVDASGAVTSASGVEYNSFLGALDPSIEAVACDLNVAPGDADDDLFYQVTLPNIGDSVTVTVAGVDDLVVTAFPPDACGAADPEQITCADVELEDSAEVLTYTATEANQTLLIQVYSYGGGPRSPYTVTAEVDLITGVRNLGEGAPFQVYPNPARADGALTVELPTGITDAAASLTLRDVTGRPVFTRGDLAGHETVTLAPAGLAAGVYVLSLDADGTRSSQRVIVQ